MRMRRAAAAKVHYVLLPELHADGRMHIHMLTDAGLSLRWWKDNPRECGAGYANDVQPLKDARLAGFYVTKYVTKSLDVLGWPPHFHRVRVSQGWPEQPEKAVDDGWEYVPLAKYRQECERYILEGWRVVRVDTGEVIDDLMSI